MKKQLMMSLLGIVATAGTVMAQENMQAAPPPPPPTQGQGMQMKTPSERTKETLLKLQTDLSLTNEQGGKAFAPFFDFYTGQQKMMDEMRASGTMDRDKMKAGRDELAAARDKQLAVIFTADQYKKWKDEVEPSMRPQRRPQQ